MPDYLDAAIALLTANGKELAAQDYRIGDIVFFAETDSAQAGYAILADRGHRYGFDPYDEQAEPQIVELPAGVSFFYHGSVAIDPQHLSLQDTLALLWKAHREALEDSGAPLVQTEPAAYLPGEVVLQERLDGYISLGLYGQEQPYPEPPRKKHFWSHQPSLINRPFTERHLLRVLSKAKSAATF